MRKIYPLITAAILITLCVILIACSSGYQADTTGQESESSSSPVESHTEADVSTEADETAAADETTVSESTSAPEVTTKPEESTAGITTAEITTTEITTTEITTTEITTTEITTTVVTTSEITTSEITTSVVTTAEITTAEITAAKTEPVTEPITTPVTEPITEPVTEPITTPVTEPVTEPITTPVTEPVTEPITTPVTEPITEPVTEPITTPVTEPVTEPITEPVTEPVTEPITEPVTEPDEFDYTAGGTEKLNMGTALIAAKAVDMIYNYKYDIDYYLDNGYSVINMEFPYKDMFEYSSDIDDPMIATSPYILLYRTCVENDETYNSYILIIRGTYNSEWYSNTDIKADVGELHPGFEGAADWVWAHAKPYISTDKAHNRILVTGHSRGAAAGAILASKLIDSEEYFSRENIYCYVFACPRYSRRTYSYPQIHIINNPGDFVTDIPLDEWGFHYEGSEYVLPTDSATVAKMNVKLKAIQRMRKQQPLGYVGTFDNEEVLAYVRIIMPTSDYLLNETNRRVLADVFQLLFEGKVNTTILGDFMLFSSDSEGNKQKMNFAMYMIKNSDKLAAGHGFNTYRAWIEALQ